MHAFHKYLSKQLHERLKKRQVVVWYDPNKEFSPYIDELETAGDKGEDMANVQVGDLNTHIAQFKGSYFGVRSAVEPLVAVDQPEPLLIYVPGESRNRTGSILMELEKGGDCYEPQLKRLARNILRMFYTDGVIDEMLASENVTYQDVVQFLLQIEDEKKASMLKVIFGSSIDNVTLLANWLADNSIDKVIEEKNAVTELYKLFETRLGLELPNDIELLKARSKTIRYVLVNEFRLDLLSEAPTAVSMVQMPYSKEQQQTIKEVTKKLREMNPESYIELADQVEAELGLRDAALKASDLGTVDTFRFEENLLLTYCGDLISEKQYAEAMKLVDERRRSFWVDRDVGRQAQWEAVRLMADLGIEIEDILPALSKMGENPSAWINAYTKENGWYRVDQTHRNLEAWVAKMDDEPEAERALGLVRREYEELLKKMSDGFSKAFQQAAWTVPDILHQTKIYSEVVKPNGGRVAYFLVDAMRYEMGVELTKKLQKAEDLSIRPVMTALPSITSVGMAALLPGASSSFSVVEHKGKLASCIEDTFMSGWAGRYKYLKARVPDLAEMPIGKLLYMSSKKLIKAIEDASFVVVRSKEIDTLGETGEDWLARQLMDTVVDNITRAIHKLAELGIDKFVITADHGYQFSLRKEEDMQTDNPGGNTVEIHRRCWVGRGGKTPPGTIRITGAELGYDTDLDFIFPIGIGVFSTQGGLSYHHGGFSLQELIVPVITLRLPTAVKKKPSSKVSLKDYPTTLTNRTFGVRVYIEKDLFLKDPIPLRIALLSEGEQVGQVGMAIDAEFDRDAGLVSVLPGKEASVGMMLTREDCKTIRIIIQDPTTDAVLYQSEEIPVKLGI